MGKKLLVVLLIITCIFCYSFNAVVYANELEITSPSAILIHSDTGKVLYEKNSDELRSGASITKVMTMLLTMEAIEAGELSYDDILTTSALAAGMGGSDIWLEEGEQMSVHDLIKATIIMSANDAAVVLAEAVAGSEEAFVIKMNEKAQELGMTGTTFKNSNGLDEEGHLTTARDIAVMSAKLMEYEKILDYTLTRIEYVREGETQLVNTNKLITSYNGITGLKTGTTGLAGSCISATATRDDMNLVAVVLGAESTDNRFKDATKLLDYGFANWAMVTTEFELPESVEIKGGMQNEAKIRADKSSKVIVPVAQKDAISAEVKISQDVEAPVMIGQEIGVVTIKNGEEVIETIPVEIAEDVMEINFLNALEFLLKKFDF